MEATGHKRVVFNRIAEDDQVAVVQRVDLFVLNDDLAHFLDGIHVDPASG